MKERNKVYLEDCMKTMSRMEDKSVNLIIADFPYYEVKGDFDFIWKDFDEFLEWVESVAKEFKRVLADNGSLYVYGHAKKIAYKQIIFDKYFNLENNLVWYKTSNNQKRFLKTDQYNSYPPETERILFYSNIKIICEEMNSIREYFRDEKIKTKLNYKQLDELMEIKASYGYWDKPSTHDFIIPTLNNYNKLQSTGFYKTPYSEILEEYNKLKKYYNDKKRPFKNSNGLSDVLNFSQQANITGNYNHPTQKPPKLTRALIETSSNVNDLVYIPFGGSGTELEQCHLLNRDYIGSEIEPKYYDIIMDRLKNAKDRGSSLSIKEQKEINPKKFLF